MIIETEIEVTPHVIEEAIATYAQEANVRQLDQLFHLLDQWAVEIENVLVADGYWDAEDDEE